MDQVGNPAQIFFIQGIFMADPVFQLKLVGNGLSPEGIPLFLDQAQKLGIYPHRISGGNCGKIMVVRLQTGW